MLLLLTATGCQALAPGASQPLAESHNSAANDQVAYRDDDTFTGRLTTGTRAMKKAASAPFATESPEIHLRQSRQKQQKLAAKNRPAHKRSAFTSWLFPEPKKAQTLSQWLSQDRPTGG